MLRNFFEGKPRDSFLLGTKVKSRFPLADNFEEEFFERVDLSLQRLKMDYVDIFYAHDFRSLEEVHDPRMLAAMKKVKSDGKARHLGFSTHAHKPELLDAAIEVGIYDVILLSYNFKLDNIPETEAAMKRAAEAGIGLVVMKAMTGGTEDAEGNKKINAQACLKWVWQNPHVTTVISGFSNYDEFDECLAAVQSPEITTDDRQYLAGLRENDMLFCQQCGQCTAQCTRGLPVPDIMRAYMYTYGYRFAALSKETPAELNISGSECDGCETCTVTCPSGFDVPRKIAAVTPVLNIPNEFLC